MNHQDIINQLRKSLPQTIAQEIVGVQPMNIRAKTPETWQGYLRRLGNGLNGIVAAGGKTNFSQEDILANAQKYMQAKYPGPYRVEEYYNADKMKWDLRLKFEDPKEETMWLLRQS